MSRGAVTTREARECEREQGAGGPRSGDATGREALAATGMSLADNDARRIIWHEATRRNAGDDRRIAAGRRQHGISVMRNLSEAAT